MMGRREEGQGQFLYSFDLDKVVPPDHLVRQIDGLLDLSWVHKQLAPNCETRHKFALKDFETDANGTRKDNIRCDSISEAQGQKPRQPAVRSFKDHKDDQPDTEDAQPQDQQALE